MPNIQRSPVLDQNPPEKGPSKSRDDVSKEQADRRQKRKMQTSPPSAIRADATGNQLVTESILELRQEFADCISEMREFRKQMAQLRESFSLVAARLVSVEQRVAILEQRQPTNDTQRTEELEQSIAELKMQINDRDQEALLSDLEIGHLPETTGENPMQAVSVLATRLGVTLEERDVVFAERVDAPPGESGRVRRLVVRLALHGLRDDLLRAARVRRTLTAADGTHVYLNERLTRHNRQLFHRAREECRLKRWRYAWTRRGRIFVRQEDGKPVYQVRAADDVVRIFGPTNVS